MAEPSTRIHYVMAVARALVSSDKPVSPPQVYDWLEANGLRRVRNAPAGTELDQDFHKEVRFARQELADCGLVRSVNGLWTVVQLDDLLHLTPDLARDMITRNRRDRDDRRDRGEHAGPSSMVRRFDPSPTTGPDRQNGRRSYAEEMVEHQLMRFVSAIRTFGRSDSRRGSMPACGR